MADGPDGTNPLNRVVSYTRVYAKNHQYAQTMYPCGTQVCLPSQSARISHARPRWLIWFFSASLNWA